MPLISSTYPVQLSKVKTAFGGGTPPQNVRAFLAGGSYTPANTAYLTVADAGAFVPTSGTLKISNFRSASYATVADIAGISAESWNTAIATTVISGSCSLAFTNQGVVTYPQDQFSGLVDTETGGVTPITVSGNWLATDPAISTTTSSAIASLFEVSLTKTSGALSLTGSGTWFTFPRTFSVSDTLSAPFQSGSSSRGIVGTLSIRRADTQVVVATTTVSLTVSLEIVPVAGGL